MCDGDVRDLVAIGFGPAGIALAAAIDDLGEKTGTDYRARVMFLESNNSTGWQRGLLLRNADIQHHYLRDLATPRDPRSYYTFANFLKEHDRIFEFGSLVYGGGGGAVSRTEWSHYVTWAAEKLDSYVCYGEPVLEVEFAHNGEEDLLKISTAKRKLLSRSIAYCAGQEITFPAPLKALVGERVFHGTEFLKHITRFNQSAKIRFCVVGAGQSAIETVLYIHGNFPNSSIDCVQRSLGFHHGNHSPFIQKMFHPKESDKFFNLNAQSRRDILREVARANYAAVDREAVSALYRTLYEDELLGLQRVRMVSSVDLEAARKAQDGSIILDVVGRHDGVVSTVEADVVVAATGFSNGTLPGILEPLRHGLQFDANGSLELGYDFAARLGKGVRP